MGDIEATSLAYERSVLATNPAVARGRFNVRHSITNWRLALVRSQDPARLPPASEALASPSKLGSSLEKYVSYVREELDA
jgi:hypothetical protein